MINLEKLDSVPLAADNFSEEFSSWLTVTVDSIGSNIDDIDLVLSSIDPILTITQQVDLNSRYIPQNILQTVFTLPNFAFVGSQVAIIGFGAGGWKLLCGAGQTIKVASSGASASASITSSSRYDSISIMCVEENTTWTTVSSETTGFTII